MTLRRQAASLMVMHAADVLQPLLILPFAGKVLGPSAFGQYAYTLAVTQFGSMVVDYGFYFTARRAAASARNDPLAIRIILAEVTAAKFVLFLALCLVGLIGTGISTAISLPVFYCLLLAGFGGVLSPVWLFVALERPWLAAIPIVLARGFALITFLTSIRSPSQAYLAAAIQVSIPLVTAAISLPFVITIGLGGFKAVTLNGIIAQLREGRHSFVSIAAYTATALLPVTLVQHFGGFAAAGQYSVAEKLINAVRPIFRVVADSLMPKVAYLAAHDPAKGLAVIGKSLGTLVIGVSLSALLYVIGPYIIILLFGSEFSGATKIVRLLCVIPILFNIGLCMAQLYMFNYGHERAWTVLIVAGLLAFLATSYLLSYRMDGAEAVALGFVASELLIALVSTGFFVASYLAQKRSERPLGGAEPKSRLAACDVNLES